MRHLAWGALGIVLAASGCYKSQYKSTLAQLKQCQEDQATCVEERGKEKARADAAETSLAACTKDKDEALAAKAESEKLVEDMRSNLSATRKELDELRKARAEAEKRLAAFKALTARFQKMIDTGKIKVLFRNGRMILKLPAGILFASGSAELSPEGEQALAEVATILKEFPDRLFMVAGHTDSIPLPRRSKFKNNWGLSSARALTVTEFLISQGVDPRSLSAAGYGEFDPVGDNASEEGRQENRRIEIVLLPKIDEMPTLDP